MNFKIWFVLSETLDALTKGALEKYQAPPDELAAFIKELEDNPNLIDRKAAFAKLAQRFPPTKQKPVKQEDGRIKLYQDKLNANQIWQGVFTNSSPATINTYLMTFGNGSVTAPYNSVGANQVGVSESGIYLDIGTHINQWLYLVATKTGTTLTIYCYKQGSLLQNSGTINWNGDNFATTNNYQLARHWTGGSVIPLQGNMASVSIYNRALSASEILQNYNAQKSRFNL
jgi:hypothetical protein